MRLPTYSGTIEDYAPRGEAPTPRAPDVPLTHTAFAAAHVVSDPLAERDPWLGRPAVDWENTLRFRCRLWDQGLSLAEAMDTAQRGMGVDWPTAKELIGGTMREARAHLMRPRVACGAGTDHVPLADLATTDSILAAHSEQMEAFEAAGGQFVPMAARAFPATGARPDLYADVYAKLIDQAAEPVILHRLGDMFDPPLRGYWKAEDVPATTDAVLAFVGANRGKIDGIKVSLLDRAHEEAFRARLPESVRLYTGDDLNYADPIEGDGRRHSHALLGVFAAIAPAASQALEALAQGNADEYHALLAPTVPLSREIFKAPTRFYKTGIAWLNGAQSHFVMPGGLRSSREITHYAEVFRLADQARLLSEPDLAVERMRLPLRLRGIG